MKVILSWSGELSHLVAKIFRDWFPSVIQSIEPYVSSEDIDKGTRWSTDIAKELEDSSFGILCVTKDNFTAPWLTFEAGALSKTIDKSFVSPFLFDIKRSEIEGPILQFQSTIFKEEDVLKLVKTLNKASDDIKLSEERLEKAFSTWWPQLKEQLDQLSGKAIAKEVKSKTKINNSELLEEILELSRSNTKLLRTPVQSEFEILDRIDKKLASLSRRESHFEKSDRYSFQLQEVFHDLKSYTNSIKKPHLLLETILEYVKDDFPHLNCLGKDLIVDLKSKKSEAIKSQLADKFFDFARHTIFNVPSSFSPESRSDLAHFIFLSLEKYV